MTVDRNAKVLVRATLGGMSPTYPRPGRTSWYTVVILVSAAAIAGCDRGPATPMATTVPASPSASAADAAAARSALCTAATVAAQSVQSDSARSPIDGRIALLNGAGMLGDALASPAVPGDLATKAKALVAAYRAAVVASSASAAGTDDPRWTAAVQEVTDATAALKTACS
ncbi:hypothetical protein MAUB1S_03008 [Mycolicibacterium aubagnense]